MEILATVFLKEIYHNHKEKNLAGKWITLNHIIDLFKHHKSVFKVQEIGLSEEKRPIFSLKIGTGKKKILIWSQMHGNESTGTKALFDLFNCFSFSNEQVLNTILTECTLLFIPMLNPDGSKAYTRANANKIDLNRDAVERIAIESKILRTQLEYFNPQFCFNLHDQRTIFAVEGTKNTATISFLAPSEEITRGLTEGRINTMNVIVAMNTLLQRIIPNHVGRYTDEFYPTATGDNFQKLGYNTILIESGHFPEDYNREKSREFTFYAILQGFYHIATSEKFIDYKPYFSIPNNAKLFYDVFHRYSDTSKNRAFQYKDEVIDNKLVSSLIEIKDKDINGKIGHREIVFEDIKN